MEHQNMEQYLEAAIFSDGKRVLAMNEKASGLLSSLRPGDPLPQKLEPPDEGEWEGGAGLDGRSVHLRCIPSGEGWLYLIRPREQDTLTQDQMDGVMRQLRTLAGEFYCQLAPCIRGDEELELADKARFVKSYDRLLRLMDHLEFLREEQELKHPQPLELGDLCAMIALECDGLLQEMGIRVIYERPVASVWVLGDRELIRDALTELISNCAKRLNEGGEIHLGLYKRGGNARICITDNGPEATASQRLGISSPGSGPCIPTPDMGAGLGLTTAYRVATLHGGSLMFSYDGAPKAYLSLPETKKLGGMPVQAPIVERNGGMNPYVIALSDVLPGSVILEDWLE